MPAGGDEVERDLAGRRLTRGWSAEPSSAPLTLVPLIEIFRTTLCSVLSPLLVKLKVNVGGGLDGSVFVEPVLSSVVPPTLTESSECP